MLKNLRDQTKTLIQTASQPLFIYLIVVGNGIMLSAVTLFYWIEVGLNPKIDSFLDCLWWGVATITSVGLGDIYPVTFAGKCVGILLMYTGTLLFVSFAGFLATFWMQVTMRQGMQPLEREVRIEESELLEMKASLLSIQRRLDGIETHLKEN